MSADDGRCYRCGCAHSNFRVRCVGRWRPVCRGCVEPGDEVWLDLPNGQVVADVAPEVST